MPLWVTMSLMRPSGVLRRNKAERKWYRPSFPPSIPTALCLQWAAGLLQETDPASFSTAGKFLRGQSSSVTSSHEQLQCEVPWRVAKAEWDLMKFPVEPILFHGGHQELEEIIISKVLVKNWMQARGKRYGNICICITDSLCYKAETNTPL